MGGGCRRTPQGPAGFAGKAKRKVQDVQAVRKTRQMVSDRGISAQSFPDSGGANGFRFEGDFFPQDPSANLRIAVEAVVSEAVLCGGKAFRETNSRGRNGAPVPAWERLCITLIMNGLS